MALGGKKKHTCLVSQLPLPRLSRVLRSLIMLSRFISWNKTAVQTMRLVIHHQRTRQWLAKTKTNDNTPQHQQENNRKKERNGKKQERNKSNGDLCHKWTFMSRIQKHTRYQTPDHKTTATSKKKRRNTRKGGGLTTRDFLQKSDKIQFLIFNQRFFLQIFTGIFSILLG